MHEEDPHEARPQQRLQAGGRCAAPGEARDERDRERPRHEQREGAVEPAHHRVARQVGAVAALLGLPVGLEQPADVCMPQAAHDAAEAGGLTDVGRMRIALLVGEGVVLAVVGDPVEHRPLDRI